MLVSILSAVHNEEKFLSDMIDSVQAQDHRDWELIIVDDSSSDSTLDIATARAATDNRIIVERNAGFRGKVGAFNHAYSRSRGDVVVLLAGDDRIPTGSLSTRVHALGGVDDARVAYFRLRTFSEDPKFDGMVVPRGAKANRSGGTMTLTRPLADIVFPIAPSLPAEDIWLAYAASAHAVEVVERLDVVLEYRIHPNNSNPRHMGFNDMSQAIHVRNRAWVELLNEPRFAFTAAKRQELEDLWEVEQLRHAGQIAAVIRAGKIPVIQRLAIASMTNAKLYGVRKRFYRTFSGWR